MIDIITSSLLSVSLNNVESSNFYFHDFRVEVIWEMSVMSSSFLRISTKKEFVLKCYYFILFFCFIIFFGGGGGVRESFDDAVISL